MTDDNVTNAEKEIVWHDFGGQNCTKNIRMPY
jgi:hypothetical protein